MANVQEGGDIVIGIVDGTFIRQGVTSAQKATFNIDIIKDQIAPYADPHVNIRVEHLLDASGMEYVILTVLPFE